MLALPAATLLATAVAMVFAAAAIGAEGEHSPTWLRPVPDRGAARPFRAPRQSFAAGGHRGVDLAAAPGTLVHAACSGRVSFAGVVGDSGRTVAVRCGGLVATYLHLGTIAVRRGERIEAGAGIGTVGRTGDDRTPRPHLHLGARDAATGRYLDPLTLLHSARQAPPLGPAPTARAPRPLPPSPSPSPLPRGEVRGWDRDLGPSPVRERGRRDAGTVPHPSLAAWLGLALAAAGVGAGGIVARRRPTLRPRPARRILRRADQLR